jgi:hypothetical protein
LERRVIASLGMKLEPILDARHTGHRRYTLQERFRLVSQDWTRERDTPLLHLHFDRSGMRHTPPHCRSHPFHEHIIRGLVTGEGRADAGHQALGSLPGIAGGNSQVALQMSRGAFQFAEQGRTPATSQPRIEKVHKARSQPDSAKTA